MKSIVTGDLTVAILLISSPPQIFPRYVAPFLLHSLDPLRRTIQRLIQDPLAMQILEGQVLPGDHIRVDRDAKKDAMRFERTASQKTEKQPANAARI